MLNEFLKFFNNLNETKFDLTKEEFDLSNTYLSLMMMTRTTIKRKRSKIISRPSSSPLRKEIYENTHASIERERELIFKVIIFPSFVSFSFRSKSKKIKWKRNFSRGPAEIGEILWSGEEVVEDSSEPECFP